MKRMILLVKWLLLAFIAGCGGCMSLALAVITFFVTFAKDSPAKDFWSKFTIAIAAAASAAVSAFGMKRLVEASIHAGIDFFTYSEEDDKN